MSSLAHQPPPEYTYVIIGQLHLRIEALSKLLEAFSLHCLDLPAFYSRDTAQQWIEEGNRLIRDAEEALKKERAHEH